MAIGTFRVGENPPEVTLPAAVPSPATMSVAARAGARREAAELQVRVAALDPGDDHRLGRRGGRLRAAYFDQVDVDAVPQLVLAVIAIVVLAAGKGSPAALLFAMLFYFSALGVAIYNRWIRAGRTGQSWGKQVVGVRLIDEDTRQPIGAGMAFVRDLAHIIAGLIFYIGYLCPLWDQKRQTIADKMVHPIVVPADEPHSAQSAAGQRGHGAYPQAAGQYPQTGYPGQGTPQGFSQPAGYPQDPGYPGYSQRPGYPDYPQAPGYTDHR